MTFPDAQNLLRETRRLSAFASVFLGLQLFGNLYEEIVSNVRMLVAPHPSDQVSALSAGSPMYYYLPWAPLGVVLAVALAFRLSKNAPAWVNHRMHWALGFLLLAVLVKVYLVSTINPHFRDASVAPGLLHALAIKWAVLNGLAIVAVAAALWMILAWRGQLIDSAS